VDGEDEDEVEEEVQQGEEVLMTIGSDDEEGEEGDAVSEDEQEQLLDQERDGILARAQTPPAHAQFGPSASEDNPWA